MMDDYDIKLLAEQINDGFCVLFIGPDISSLDPDSIGGKSLNEELAEQLAGELGPSEDIPDGCSLHYVSHVYSKTGRNDLNKLRSKVRDYFEGKEKQTSSLHRALARMPFRLCVSTTLDRYLENAFIEKKKKPRSDFFNYCGNSPDDLPLTGDPASPLVYKLHGDIENIRSLVLTEQELVDFMKCTVVGDPPLPLNLRTVLAHKDTIFLFVGFGLYQWHLRLLLRVLEPETSENNSFAFEIQRALDGGPGADGFERTKVFYKLGKKIIVDDADVLEFVNKLGERFEDLSPPQTTVGQSTGHGIVGAAPTCFLCHSSDDKPEVEKLSHRLKESHIKNWLDKNDIEGGDQWSNRIENAIEHEVDYFVYIQSSKSTSKFEGVFREELKLAKARQRRMPERGGKFVIPVQIDDCELCPDIKADKLHSIKLREQGGFSDLVRAIRKDWVDRQNYSQ